MTKFKTALNDKELKQLEYSIFAMIVFSTWSTFHQQWEEFWERQKGKKNETHKNRPEQC